MGEHLRSALLGGFAAGFIFMFISNLTGMGPTTAALVGLAFVLVGALVTGVIAGMIHKSHTGRT